ncbi:hypothetical protein KQX54_013182 [Cotesia glomerata]|uniref:Uncharacterized protein n=1 Tax=Cotesia glomerata TaxID=32391 RepID=A0AAV7J3E0_COTGL|nr:hypothetical protein KQX54_013182 [Cotesia glomerata]
MMQHEKKNVLERIATEFIDSIKKLERILSDSEYDNWTKDYNNLIKIFEGYALKSNNSLLNSRSISRIFAIEDNSFVINSYAGFVAFYPDNGSLKNIIDLCPFVPQILDKFYSVVYSDSIVDEFNNLMDDILAEVGKKENDNACGQRSSLHEVWFIYYHRVMVTFLKKILMQFYFEFFQAICNNEYLNNTMNFFWSRLSGVTERSVKTQKALQQKINYMYRCDSSDINKNGQNQMYYELERMIQVLIVNERDLSTTRTCSINCDISTIKNTINHKECRKFRDCRFMTNSFKVCKACFKFSFSAEKEGKSKRYRWFENRYFHRKNLNLPHPDDPTKSSKNVIDSKANQFIKFRASDLKKDAGQSTVPFFDALEAEGNPNFPLGGIGIIHRGQKGFGGFLGFKIFELDLSKYFKA